MSWASHDNPNPIAAAEAEVRDATEAVQQLRARIAAGAHIADALTLAEYRLARAHRRLTHAVTQHPAPTPGGDAA